MSATTRIEWADSTFNPWIGCTKVSPACDHCYAEAQMDARLKRVQWGSGHARQRTSESYWRQPLKWNAQRFAECPTCRSRGLFDYCAPCCRNSVETRRRVFCASLADVFDHEAPEHWRWDLFRLIAATPRLDWLLLTKRIGNARNMLNSAAAAVANEFVGAPAWDCNAWPNIWLGATICNQAEADRDIPKLLRTPAAKRFLSIEPMLGEINIAPYLCDFELGRGSGGRGNLHWIICGGESGPHARPMHPDWARSLRDQCAAAGVPFMHKQNGEWAPEPVINNDGSPLAQTYLNNAAMHICDGGERLYRVGKHAAGRLLDGREHSEWPA